MEQSCNPVMRPTCSQRHLLPTVRLMSTAYKAVIAITGTLSTLVVLMLANYGRNAERRHLLRKGQRVEGTVVAIDIPGA